MYQLFANKSIFISKYREQFVAKCWQDRAAMNEKMGLEGKEEQDEGELQGLMWGGSLSCVSREP